MNIQLHSIAVLDDHLLIIEGVQKLIAENKQWQFVGGFTSHAAFTIYCNEKKCPDVLLLDIHLPGEDGIVICKELSKKYSHLKIVMLTSIAEAAIVKNTIKNGASGFMLKNMRPDELWDCLEKITKGETWLHKDIEKLMIQASISGKKENNSYIPKLSSREKQILNLIAKEMTTQEIADHLFISVNTAETHRASLLSKFGSRNIAGLIKAAMEKGMID
jgi:DNA-binding NarL/FixJ family response regulator